MRPAVSLLPLLASLALGCGPGAIVPSETGGSGATSTGPSTEGEASNATAMPPIDGSTTLPGGTTSGTSPGSDGSFIDNVDAGGSLRDCDVLLQDCPRGYKCMAYSTGGGFLDTHCTPLAEDPGAPGDPCIAEDFQQGIDDCELGAICWDVDPRTNEGVCVAFCSGSFEAGLYCEDPGTHCSVSSNAVLVLCLPICDPLLQDCPPGEACYPVSDAWECAPDASEGMGAHGDPCEFINVCDPGLVCLSPELTPGCAGASGCCTEICDLSAPLCSGAPEGQQCVPWYEEGRAPPGYEDLGVCVLPA